MDKLKAMSREDRNELASIVWDEAMLPHGYRIEHPEEKQHWPLQQRSWSPPRQNHESRSPPWAVLGQPEGLQDH